MLWSLPCVCFFAILLFATGMGLTACQWARCRHSAWRATRGKWAFLVLIGSVGLAGFGAFYLGHESRVPLGICFAILFMGMLSDGPETVMA